MADKDSDGPSLELPSLGFGRRRRPRESQEHEAPSDARDDQPMRVPTTPTTPSRVVAEPTEEVAPPDPQRRAPRRRPSLPAVAGMPAAVLTGVLVGVLGVGATWASLRLCEGVRGTSSCGDPGFLLLLAILAAMVLVGSLLLRALDVSDPTGTSFLGVGLLAVLALLFLVDVVFAWWMVLVVPGLAALTFALSHWVATTFVDVD